jgi:hypothetical protein
MYVLSRQYDSPLSEGLGSVLVIASDWAAKIFTPIFTVVVIAVVVVVVLVAASAAVVAVLVASASAAAVAVVVVAALPVIFVGRARYASLRTHCRGAAVAQR